MRKGRNFRSLRSLSLSLRRDLKGVKRRRKTAKRKGTSPVKGNNFVLLYAHNGVGKTRLSMEFKELGKKLGKSDTLYFNAYTEDLFYWENDFEYDEERRLKFRSDSHFFTDLEGMDIESLIRSSLHNYADFNFSINYTESEISFFRDAIINRSSVRFEDIKVSRGEENLFIWCFFLAILKLALEAEKGDPYGWVKYVYIDDPVSSLDEHNTITMASELAKILKSGMSKVKVIISTHHGLFFNVMFNELTSDKNLKIEKKAYVLNRPTSSNTYTLLDTSESPLLHHMVALNELQKAVKSDKVYQYHFNSFRSILERTMIFFGKPHISSCFDQSPKKALFARFLNVRSHGKYSIFETSILHNNDKIIFKEMLSEFINTYPFKL